MNAQINTAMQLLQEELQKEGFILFMSIGCKILPDNPAMVDTNQVLLLMRDAKTDRFALLKMLELSKEILQKDAGTIEEKGTQESN